VIQPAALLRPTDASESFDGRQSRRSRQLFIRWSSTDRGGRETSAEDGEPQNIRESNGVQGEDVVTKLSPWSVADTVARLLAVAAARDLKVFAIIDHSGEAANVGLHLRETTLVIFGSAAAGTPVMAAAPLAALDLPLRVLVWAADDHQTKLSYTAPSALARRYGVGAELAARLAGIDELTRAVIAR
jgi:uncharacterized protein (DUF302 family)